MASNTWALSQLSRLLPIDTESLQQTITYASTLPKETAAEHFKTLLGDSPQALEFISSFNSRRQEPSTGPQPTTDEPSHVPRKSHKKKAPLHKLPPPRQPENHGNVGSAYQKKDEDDYMSATIRPRKETPLVNTSILSLEPEAVQRPTPSKPPPSASGPLISDLPNVRTKTPRTASPAPQNKTKITLTGGPAMHGASTTLSDLDSAIQSLELQTNPTLSTSPSTRRCTCLATRHPLLTAAPNCLNCGKIICVKEGLGPCTFCGSPLLTPQETNSMIRALRSERGQEKMSQNNASHRRPDVAQTPRPFTTTTPPSTTTSATETSTLDLARQHRDKLLTYQSQNARRTHVIDEAADFETPTAGQSMWSSPVERAAQLKRQQKVLREQEWNARPEYEKRRVVVSVDLVGGKVVRRMAEVEKRREDWEDTTDVMEDEAANKGKTKAESSNGGAFSRNPLLGSLIRPIWKAPDIEADSVPNGNLENGGPEKQARHSNMWRKVQDDNDDNEAVILNGGVYGGGAEGERRLGAEERAVG